MNDIIIIIIFTLVTVFHKCTSILNYFYEPLDNSLMTFHFCIFLRIISLHVYLDLLLAKLPTNVNARLFLGQEQFSILSR